MLLIKINLDRLNKERIDADSIESVYRKRNLDLYSGLIIEGRLNSLKKFIHNEYIKHLNHHNKTWVKLDEKSICLAKQFIQNGIKKLIIPYEIREELDSMISTNKLILSLKFDNKVLKNLKQIKSEYFKRKDIGNKKELSSIILDAKNIPNSESDFSFLLKQIQDIINIPIILDFGQDWDNIDFDSQRCFGFALNIPESNDESLFDKILMNYLDFEKMNGLIPTIVKDTEGNILMLAYSSKNSLKKAINFRKGVYFSRSRNELWIKGETSGNFQELKQIKFDCDKDALLFIVKQTGKACHIGSYSCFSDDKFTFDTLYEIINEKVKHATKQESYTKRISENKYLLLEKIQEESNEIINYTDRSNLIWEIADLIYFLGILMVKNRVNFQDILIELERRRK